jgi:hypothetical protein
MKFRKISTLFISIISLLIIIGFSLQDIFAKNVSSTYINDEIIFLVSSIVFYSAIIYLALRQNLKHQLAISWITFFLSLSPILFMLVGFAIFVSAGGC